MPESCGLGGDAFMLVRSPQGEVTAVNGSGAAGSAVDPSRVEEGPGSVAVPGFVAALDDAHSLFARLSLERLLEPAVSLAGGGFPVGGSLLAAIAERRDALERGAPGWALLDPGLRAGSLVRAPALVGVPGAEPLSDSELAVLRLLPAALSNREIGARLYISVNTVKTHLRSVYAKLGASSRDQAVGRARELGLI